jgi:hypothetical protein
MRNKALNIIIPLIFIAVFNTCYFTLVDIHSRTRWVCHAAIHAAYLLLWISTRSIPEAKGGNVHGYPRIGVAYSYFVITLFLGIVLIATNPDSIAWPVVIFSVTTGLFLTAYAFLMKAEGHSIASDRVDARHLYFIRDCSEQLQEIMRQTTDPDRRRQVERVYDAIRNAQVTGVPQAAGAEARILEKIGEMAEQAGAADALANIVTETLTLIRRRDSLIRMAR